jgi:tripeptide aminopeptidase
MPAAPARIASELHRIARLAEQSSLARAHQWFLQKRAWINEQHLQLCRIAAPTFFEQRRAEWVRTQMETWGWRASLDRAGNVLASFGEANEHLPRFMISAHLDTVFAPSRPEDVYFGPGGRLLGPGTADNGAGLTALLVLARLLSEITPLHPLAQSLLLVATVGEEGEGNLGGMRYLCRPSGPVSESAAIIVLDGPSTSHIAAQALASRRLEISFTGPGGHSWNDYGTPNPIHALAGLIFNFREAAAALLAKEIDSEHHAAFNFGIVEGGFSVNSIASEARTKLDLRSDDPTILEKLANLLTAHVESSVERENRSARGAQLTAKIREMGSRPAGKLQENSLLLRTAQAVDAFLKIRSTVGCASTDANVPLSLGFPAISIGAGGQGGGAHTRHEWYLPEGRELGLRRILLIAAALFDQSQNGAYF